MGPVSGLLALLVVAHAMTAGRIAQAAAPDKQPLNVVLILADDLGWSDLGCYGSRFHETPNIDRLARRGRRFTQYYAANPLCSPTRASLLTGLYPARIGITTPGCHLPQEIFAATLPARAAPHLKAITPASATRLRREYRTLAESLAEAGYVTAHLGKWHLGPTPYSPLEQGFASDLPHTPGPGPGGVNGYFAPWAFWPNAGAPEDHIEDRMAEEAVRFLQAHRDRPFYLNYWAFSVHSPWMAKPAYVERYGATVDPQAPQRSPIYAGMVRSLDDAVGRILETLDELQLTERTAIVFTSDNGGWIWPPRAGPRTPEAWASTPITSNAPLRGGKATIYEGGTRVPLIVSWPGVTQADTTSDVPCQSIDVSPTVHELIGVTPPAEQPFDGVSLAPALRGGTLDRDTLFCHFPHYTPATENLPATWVRRGDWKLIRFYCEGPGQANRHELYQLADDIGETTNLAGSQPDMVLELDALIDKHLRVIDAPVPIPNPDYRADARPGAPAKPAVADGGTDPLQGWKARRCEAKPSPDGLLVRGAADDPFLGFGAGRRVGPATLRMRIRAPRGGAGRVVSLPSGRADNDAGMRASRFEIAAHEEWQQVSVDLSAAGPLGILRLHLPATEAPVVIAWIELRGTGAETFKQRWEFGK